jgi:hypothetical protein
MNSYELSRIWFDWSFENPEKISPNHSALYFFAIEHCNRLGWRRKFGFPTEMAKDAIGIKSYNTYIKTLNDLVDWGFIEMIEKSKNQYSSNIIALSNFNKALDKALDKAIVKHVTKQSESTIQSISSIDKPITNNQEPLTNNKKEIFNFKKKLIEYGFYENLVSEWLQVRKNKKATNTETSFKKFISEIEKRNCNLNEILEIIVSNSWSGFSWAWIDNLKKQNLTNSPIEKEQMFGRMKQSTVEKNFQTFLNAYPDGK